jgi:hypothetical protein
LFHQMLKWTLDGDKQSAIHAGHFIPQGNSPWCAPNRNVGQTRTNQWLAAKCSPPPPPTHTHKNWTLLLSPVQPTA